MGNNAGDVQFSDYEGISWYNNFFAGSTGGEITEYTLIRNLLQTEYTYFSFVTSFYNITINLLLI